jgi:hypothetical protein
MLILFWPFGGREAALFLLDFLEGLALTLLSLEGATVDLAGSSIGTVVDSFAADGTKGVDLPSFPTFVFLEGAAVDLAGSSVGTVVDSFAADGTKRGDLLFLPAFVFLEGAFLEEGTEGAGFLDVFSMA